MDSGQGVGHQQPFSQRIGGGKSSREPAEAGCRLGVRSSAFQAGLSAGAAAGREMGEKPKVLQLLAGHLVMGKGDRE